MTLARSTLAVFALGTWLVPLGLLAQTPQSSSNVPWAGVKETESTPTPELPSFLQVAERRATEKRPPPTSTQLRALREMQTELGRFSSSGVQYETTVDEIVRREYLRRRRERDNFYGRQIREEERLQNAARDEAIKAFEAFIIRNPDHPTYTPDAMFRLGELYYERSATEFQRQAALAQAQVAEADTPDAQPSLTVPNFTPTIEIYHRLAQRFPDYRNISSVYYLIGYCWNEMAQPERARLAWLNLTCANKFRYDPKSFPDLRVSTNTPTAEEKAQEQHPVLRTRAVAEEKGPFIDPYADCVPVQKNAEFLSETWLRIGEYHFDYDYQRYGLDRAISAYRKLLADPKDRNYNLALYKLAWTYYRASRYAESIKHFGMLIDWSDEQRKLTGKAGSELRAEAVQYMGIAFAFDDWNQNQIPDVQEGLPSGFQRLQDPQYMPQDRPWTVEIYDQVGSVYFDEAKYPEAIRVWELTLSKWPLDPRAPELQHKISLAFSRHGQMHESILAKAKLQNYVEGSKWWNANLEHPEAQRRAEELLEGSLVNTAVYHHRRAQELRRQSVDAKNVDLFLQAKKEYALAATAYRFYLTKYPNNVQAYELRYDLADALFWSESYEEAASEYAAVRDSNLDDKHLSESARRVVESLKRIIEQHEAAGKLVVRKEPPPAEGSPPHVRPVQMPLILQRMAHARETYLARVDAKHDVEGVRDSYDYNNALLLYQYGYWPQAKERFTRIFAERCTGPMADDTGRVAWLDLRNMAVVEQQTEEIERLGRLLSEKKCTFGGKAGEKPVDCKLAKNREEPQCLAGADLTNLKYKRAVDIFAQAQRASGAEQQRLYEEAATVLVKAVNEEPSHPQAPLALEKAAIALELTNRYDSAGRLYQRIIDDVSRRKAADEEEQKRLDAILANAHFRLAFNANRFFDYDMAVRNYQTLADSTRFAQSKDPEMPKRREDALINAAKILEYQQQYSQSAKYYLRAAGVMSDPNERRIAAYRAAEMPYKEGKDAQALRDLRAFIAKYNNDRAAGELIVLAHWRIAQITRRSRADDNRRALRHVVEAFSASRLPPGSVAAEYAAEADFSLADMGIDQYEKIKIDPGKPATLKAYVDNVKKAIDRASATATLKSRAYEPVLAYRRPKWTIAAYVRQGRVYEILAKAVLNTPFVMPKDLAKQISKASPEQREEIRVQVEDRLRQVLDEMVKPIECLAVARYALAARAARAGSLDNEYTQIATDRLQAYGDERIAECVKEAAAKDSTFEQYKTGEFTRAPRGQTRSMPNGVSTPPITEHN